MFTNSCRWLTECSGVVSLYSNTDSRGLWRSFMRHSLSDTSFNSQGLVPSSLLFCNYIALQHICILAHAHTHTRTNARTLADKHSNIYSILHLLTDIHAPAHMHKHTPHTLQQAASASSNHQSVIWGIETEMEWREVCQTKWKTSETRTTAAPTAA